MDEEFLQARTKARKITKAELKAREILLDFMETDYFLEKIKSLRRTYQIPENGYDLTSQELENVKASFLGFLPLAFKIVEKNKMFLFGEINKAVINIFKERIEISSFYTSRVVSFYLFFNKIELDLFREEVTGETSLIQVRDVRRDLEESVPEYNAHIFDNTPIGILIHPETTRRDMERFINDRWKEIEIMLSPYTDPQEKSPLKNIKIKTDKARLRDKIIYKNKEKSPKEISTELRKEKIFLDYGNISNYKKKVIAKRKKA